MNQGNINPALIEAFMRQQALEERDADLQGQVALGQSMQKPGPQREGPMGQGLQSIADIINAIRGGNAMQGAQAERLANRSQRQGDRETVAQWWLEQQNQPSAPGGEGEIPAGAEALYSYEGMTPDLIPDLLRRPMDQYEAPTPDLTAGEGDLNVGVAPVPPPLDPTVKAEALPNYKARHQAGRPARG